MMDNFKEDIVSPRSNALGNALYALCWVFIVLFGAYALMMLQVVMVQFSVLTLVTVAMAAACAVLLFFIKDQLKVEYEYTLSLIHIFPCADSAVRAGADRFRLGIDCRRRRFDRWNGRGAGWAGAE